MKKIGDLKIGIRELLSEKIEFFWNKKVFDEVIPESKIIHFSSINEKKQLIIPNIGNIDEGIESYDGYIDVEVELQKGWKIDFKNRKIEFSGITNEKLFHIDLLDGIDLKKPMKKDLKNQYKNSFNHSMNGWKIFVEIEFIGNEFELEEKIDELENQIDEMKNILQKIKEIKKKMSDLNQRKMKVNSTYC